MSDKDSTKGKKSKDDAANELRRLLDKDYPDADAFEEEWTKKIKESKGDEILSIKDSKKKAETLEEVFSQLRSREEPPKSVGPTKTRLQKIGGSVKGTAPELKERELTGESVSGIYKIYPIGGYPPFNLLSRLLSSISSKTLDGDLKRSNIPLYADEYAKFSVAISAVLALVFFMLVFLISGLSILMALMAFFLILIIFSLLIANLPSLQHGAGSKDVDKQLPFALRHMSALLSAGISIFDSVVSVAKSDYGKLSTELDKVVWDVKAGESFPEALNDAAERLNSHSFTRVTIHIRRALQMGGDVSKIIGQIADDLTFEMRMKIADFVEKLNIFAIVFLIGGVVGPVVIAVFTVVSNAKPLQSVGGGGMAVDTTMLMFMVLFVFPMMMALIAYIVKAMEPKV